VEYDLNYYSVEAEKLALEIERKLVILGFDWRDDAAMRRLAQDLLEVRSGVEEPAGTHDYRDHAWQSLQGLVGLMNVLMAEGASKNVAIHGNDAWKALSRAMWAAKPDAGPAT
jgi:hypothetical protein